jgi:hypothetical protein
MGCKGIKLAPPSRTKCATGCYKSRPYTDQAITIRISLEEESVCYERDSGWMATWSREMPQETDQKPRRPSVRIISFQWRFQIEILPNCNHHIAKISNIFRHAYATASHSALPCEQSCFSLGHLNIKDQTFQLWVVINRLKQSSKCMRARAHTHTHTHAHIF